jgi:hypothetical protein
LLCCYEDTKLIETEMSDSMQYKLRENFQDDDVALVSDRRRCLYRSANYFDYSTQLLATFRRTHSARERDSNRDRSKAKPKTFVPCL